LSGKITDANIAVNFLANLQISVALGWAVGGGGMLYGYSQNKLRKRDVRRLHSRLERFERMHDPNRTTSQLGPTGDTNVEDA